MWKEKALFGIEKKKAVAWWRSAACFFRRWPGILCKAIASAFDSPRHSWRDLVLAVAG
ncbi:hypothetical protein [Mesorhizobium sp. M0488]|uniref:hypothetical protein n=1 Tax=unclassified Mesorhizobium TaxID=325217 RepID=UPI00333768B0